MHSRHLLRASALVALLVLAVALPLHIPAGPAAGVELAAGSPDDGERGVLIDPDG